MKHVGLEGAGMDKALPADERGRLAALSALAILDTDPEPEYEHITELARTMLDAPIAAVTIISADRQWFKAVQGLDMCESAREDSFCTVTIQRPEPMVVEDACEHPLFQDNVFVVHEPHIRSYLGVPLVLPSGHHAGALCVIDFRPRTFNEQQVASLRQLARCVEKEFALRLQATLDDLTGCLNRQFFFERVERTLARVRSGQTEASLAILDLDHFKSVNDTHGHETGDMVLKAAAEALTFELAGLGEVGRIGGEEFAVLFPSIAHQRVFEILEDVRRRIASLSFPSVPDLKVTTSGGFTPLRPQDPDPIAAFKRADVALYEAKGAGRNQIISIVDDPSGSHAPSKGVAGLIEARLRDTEPADS
jgi:diguanylate cyclase (GGDEF)-like protein